MILSALIPCPNKVKRTAPWRTRVKDVEDLITTYNDQIEMLVFFEFFSGFGYS